MFPAGVDPTVTVDFSCIFGRLSADIRKMRVVGTGNEPTRQATRSIGCNPVFDGPVFNGFCEAAELGEEQHPWHEKIHW
jgi:hypothetical protein